MKLLVILVRLANFSGIQRIFIPGDRLVNDCDLPQLGTSSPGRSAVTGVTGHLWRHLLGLDGLSSAALPQGDRAAGA